MSSNAYNPPTNASLSTPIPNMDARRLLKKSYRELPIQTTHPLFNEPLVPIAEYGIAGQAYYSRPNAATGQPVPGVPTTLYLRESVTQTLAHINAALQHPIIEKLFGGSVELYVEDALRPVSLQRRLHDTLIPRLLRKNHPNLSAAAIADRLRDIIAVPSADPASPSPHATGGALDVTIRYRQANRGYVPDSTIALGHREGDTSARINPDYYELTQPTTPTDKIAQKNRRAYYAVLTGAAFGMNTGLINNPTEWWHWGIGDQLSTKVSGHKVAYYSLAEPPIANQPADQL